MATRRIISSEKTVLDRDDISTEGELSSSTAPAVPTDVIVKLLVATFAMIVLPIGSYFLTVKTIFAGNSSYAGGFAAIMANVVLVGYVIVAMKEDQTDQLAAKKDTKKDK